MPSLDSDRHDKVQLPRVVHRPHIYSAKGGNTSSKSNFSTEELQEGLGTSLKFVPLIASN